MQYTRSGRFLRISWRLSVILIVVAVGLCASYDWQFAPVVSGAATVQLVEPRIETVDGPSPGAMDDAAIWIHPTEPSQSLIIGSAKAGGLVVYNMDGSQRQHLSVGVINNVDLRYNFPVNGQPSAVVVATDQTYLASPNKYQLKIYRVNPNTRLLEDVAGGKIGINLHVYGLCMYHSPVSGKYYVFVTSWTETGEIQQLELKATSEGKVTVSEVRRFYVGSEVEGCVADDVLGDFYVSETYPSSDPNDQRKRGIWKYGAEPGDGSSRQLVDFFGSGRFSKEIEGLTIYYTSQNTGYLILSDQAGHAFVVYKREEQNEYVKTFKIVANGEVDGVTFTDGIDVTNAPLGPTFPHGVFIAQDDFNTIGATTEKGNFNFKLVPWEAIAQGGSPSLAIDTSWDPRKVGSTTTPPPTPTPLPSTPPKTVEVVADADVYVDEARPTSNFSSSQSLRVDGDANAVAHSYLRFNIANVSEPITAARLRVYTVSSSSDGPSVYGVSNNWNEADMTWQSRIAPATGVLDDKAAITANTWVEYDVTRYVRSNGTFSFMLSTATTDGVTLSSSRSSNPPRLVLTMNGAAYYRASLPQLIVAR